MTSIMPEAPIIAILTDFGLSDSYVGAVKGEILKRNPEVKIVDLTHAIPAQDVRLGAFHLMVSMGHFPKGTVFLSVVDPGVGGDRAILVAKTEKYAFVGPDNGILSWALEKDPPRFVKRAPESLIKGASPTFHARDVMAPIAGDASKGDDFSTFNVVERWESIPFPKPQKIGSLWKGEVLAVDHFGNLITNFSNDDVQAFATHSAAWLTLKDGASTVRGFGLSYSSVPEGKPLMIPGSMGFLEVAARNASVAEQFKMKVGDSIRLEFKT